MAEAVGVISLGLQVAQGLLKYYSDFKAYNDDIANAVSRIERFRSILSALEVPVARYELNGNSLADRVRVTIRNSEQAILLLSEIVKKCDNTLVPHNTSARITMAKTKALYPFRKRTMADVVALLDRAQADLDTAINVLQLDTTFDVIERSDASIAQMQQSSDTVVRLERSFNGSAEEVKIALRLHQQQMEEQMKEQQAAFLAQLSVAMIKGNVLTPSAVSKGIHSYQSIHSRAVSTRRPRLRHCSCPRSSSINRWTAGRLPLVFSWKRDPGHNPSCPLYHFAQRSEMIGTGMRFCGYMFTHVLEFTMTYTRGAGGMSIYPMLKLGRTVDKSNPAIELLYNRSYELLSKRSYELLSKRSDEISTFPVNVFRSIKREMDRYFRDGTICPWDTTIYGETLLERAFPVIFSYTTYCDSPDWDLVYDFIKFFVDAGTPVTKEEGERRSCSVLDTLITICPVGDLSSKMRVCSYLADSGASWSIGETLSGSYYTLISNLVLMQNINEALDDHPIFIPILRKSMPMLAQKIISYPDICEEPGIFEKMLRFSADWPEGLRYLLQQHPSRPIRSNHDPLLTAPEFGNIESAELLLEAGYEISIWEVEWAIANRKVLLLQHMMDNYPWCVARPPKGALDPTGRTSLPEHLFHHSDLAIETAEVLFEADLYDLEVEFNRLEWLDFGYYISSKSTMYNVLGKVTPIWVHSYRLVWTGSPEIEKNMCLVSWLVGKGACESRCHPRIFTTAAHLIGAAPVNCILWNVHRRRPYTTPYHDESRSSECGKSMEKFFASKDLWSFYTGIISNADEDGCNCACSKSGCLRVSGAFKFGAWMQGTSWSWLQFRELSSNEKVLARQAAIYRLASYLGSHLSGSPQQAIAVLRVITFEKLNIRHTCHDALLQGEDGLLYDETEIAELHEEDKDLISKLEALMIEIEERYCGYQGTFHEFLQDYWTPRMEEVLDEMSVVTEEHVRGIEEIGVILQPFGPEVPPGFGS